MSARFLTESEGAEHALVSLGSGNGTPSSLDDVTFLRLPQVKAVTGLSKTSLYSLIRARHFPAPVRLGPRAVAWVRSEVKQWAANCVIASRTAVPLTGGKRMSHSARPESASSKRSA
jgi:prophage regulatory protein